MSNLKRSRPDHQDAILKKLQEISSARMDYYKNESSSIDSELNISDIFPSADGEQKLQDGDKSSIPKNVAKDETKPAEISISPMLLPPCTPKCITPDLVVKSKNDEIVSNSDGAVSFTTYISKSAVKSQHLVKGLYALSVSDTSDCSASSQMSSNRTNILPSFYSPKLGRRFESVPDYKSAVSSPTSPCRKYFRLMSSPTSVAGGVRRGSEPLLDSKDLNEVQLSMTDRRWERLRSILVAMKNEPYDIDSDPGLSTSEMTSNLKDNINTQEELASLKTELSALHIELEAKDSEMNKVLNERNKALAYIKKLKLADKIFDDENRNKVTVLDYDTTRIETSPDENLKQGGNVNTREIERLKKEGATKEDVLVMLTRVVDELQVERSYLNHLMSVVLDRAPWMLDEVDRGGHWMDDVSVYSSEDDEVWC